MQGDPNGVVNGKGNKRVPFAFEGGLELIKIPRTIEKLIITCPETINRSKEAGKGETAKKKDNVAVLPNYGTYPHESGITHIEY